MSFAAPFPATESWVNLLNKIIVIGKLHNPREKATLEILGNRTLVDMKFPIVDVPERKLGYHFMAAEAAWILSGDNRVSTIKPFSRAIANFSDDGVRFFGAYGPRIVDQMGHVVRTLSEDQESRQAVISIWRPNPPKSKDIPCTISVQWMVREGKLHCFLNMRSSDIWLGVPYDWFNFSCLSMGILLRLRDLGITLELGFLHFNAASQHLYLDNLEEAKVVIKAPENKREVQAFEHNMFLNYDDLVSSLWNSANKQGFGVWMEPFV